MSRPLLSICIPTYNCREILAYSILLLEEAVDYHQNKAEIEIVFSDNDSDDSTWLIIDEFMRRNKKLNIVSNKNENNLGMASNFHKVVEVASGKYCWIIGSDDFLKKESISTIIESIKYNLECEFFSLVFDQVDIGILMNQDYLEKKDMRLNLIKKHLKSNVTINLTSKKEGVYKFDELTVPKMNNVMFGAVMTGIFKKELWKLKKNLKSTCFNSLETIYPHVEVYAQTLVGKEVYHISKPVITVGSGVRLWAGNNYWDGALPLINLMVWNEMLDKYIENGLEFKSAVLNRNRIATISGRLIAPLINRRYIKRKTIKNDTSIQLSKIFQKLWCYPSFYVTMAVGLISEIFNINTFD